MADMTSPESRTRRAREGLRAWTHFPAEREPRPLVLLSGIAVPGGFPTGGHKMAFLRGAIEAVPGFPDAILQAVRDPRADYHGPPLILTTATRSSTEFCTDRGRRQLPAWEAHARDVPEAIWVLDPATIAQCWQPPDGDLMGWRGTTATLQPDGRTLVMSFTGGQADWYEYPSADVLESGGALAIIPVGVYAGPSGWIAGVGQRRQVTVVLARPLGGRVVLDEGGGPVMVTAQAPNALGRDPA